MTASMRARAAIEPRPARSRWRSTPRRQTYARLTVNGHRLSDLRRVAPADRPRLRLLSMRDGLKVSGRDVLVAESWDSTGRHALERWTITRGGARPLAEPASQEDLVPPNRPLASTVRRPARRSAERRSRTRVAGGRRAEGRQAAAARFDQRDAAEDRPDVPAYYSGRRARPRGDARCACPRITRSASERYDHARLGAADRRAGPLRRRPALPARRPDCRGPRHALVEGQGFTYSTNGNPDTGYPTRTRRRLHDGRRDTPTVTPRAGRSRSAVDGAMSTTSAGTRPRTLPAPEVWIGHDARRVQRSCQRPGHRRQPDGPDLHGWARTCFERLGR